MRKAYKSAAHILSDKNVITGKKIENGNIIVKLKNMEYEYEPWTTTYNLCFIHLKLIQYRLIRKTII